ncbi:MAG: histidine phosphatase family protein [Planctomycetales bacterium]|nr:histidine phosphatase family protein [Planctomycetales bacterium]
MKTLLLLRHAKSSWDDDQLSDHDRPLNKRGRRDAPRMGRLLADQDLVPDLILTSTAKRARRTAEAVAKTCGFAGELLALSELYHAAPEECVRVLGQLSATTNRPLLVGHNPGLEELLDRLTDHDEVMPTAALAQLQLPITGWEQLALDSPATLVAIWRPRELD